MSSSAPTNVEAPGARATLLARARELVLLRRAEATVRGYSAEVAARVRALHAAGERRLHGARRLDGPLTRVAECVLLRDALRFYLRARAVASASEDPILPADRGTLDASVVTALDAPDEHLDGLASDALAALRGALAAAVAQHRRSVEVRSVTHLRAARAGRIAGLAVAIVWLLVSLGVRLFTPPNLARGKPVSASSRYPGTPDGAALVDGDTGGAYAIHTNREPNAWVMVDLQASHRIRTVKVYNRGDGWFDEGLPLELEFSDDGVAWREVALRNEHFDQHPPWRVDAGERSARYVRLRVAGRGIVSLSELEVFGR